MIYIISISTGYDVCGCYDIPTYQNPNETKEIQQFLDSMGVLQQIKLPRNKDFVTFEARLKTFDKCMKQLKQSIHTLCEAGLYYTGKCLICINIFIMLTLYVVLMLFYIR